VKLDFALSEEQEILRRAARNFLTKRCPKSLVRECQESDKGYSLELWQEIASLGWLGLVFPEDYGGAGMSFLDLAILLEEMGRACLPVPFFSTVVLGGLPIFDTGSEEQKRAYLPKVAKGELILTLALTEPSARFDANSLTVTGTAEQDGYVISGIKLFVPDAHVADFMLVVARSGVQTGPEDGITIFITDAKSPGISCELLNTIAGDKLCRIDFDHVKVPRGEILGQMNQGWGGVERMMRRAALAKCCEMIGATHRVLEMTLDYARTRTQFGHPIGSFQAIQHHCADMAIDVEGSRLITYRAAWMLSEGKPCTKEIAMAKAWTADAYRRTVALGHEIHGAIGFTMDHDLQFFTRRTVAADVSFGDASFHREMIAREIGLK
jgi:alkylation response protein AidB-like acyl-CoA dehydrogenase